MKSIFKILFVHGSFKFFLARIAVKHISSRKKEIHVMGKNLFQTLNCCNSNITISGKCFWPYHGIKSIFIMNKALPPKYDKKILDQKDNQALKSEKAKLVYVGNILEGRGIEQMALATSDIDNIQVFILGKSISEWGDNLLNRYKHILHIPSVHSSLVTDALQSFDIGISLIQNVCLSYYLECQTKVWELIASGTPQLASDFPEIRKVILDNPIGPIGRVVDPADIKKIRSTIIQMTSNPDELSIYRSNCLALRDLFTWETEGRKLIDLYNKIIGI